MRVVLVIDQFCVVRAKKFLHQKDRVRVRIGVSMLQFDTIQSYPVHLRWILGRNMWWGYISQLFVVYEKNILT